MWGAAISSRSSAARRRRGRLQRMRSRGGKVHRIGHIATTSPVSELVGPEPVNPAVRAFVQGLRVLGYVKGQNLILERRSAEGQFERFGAILAELVRLKVDVIVTAGDPMTKVAKGVSTTVPIVMAMSTDPVGEGLIQSIARPGGFGFPLRRAKQTRRECRSDRCCF